MELISETDIKANDNQTIDMIRKVIKEELQEKLFMATYEYIQLLMMRIHLTIEFFEIK